MMQRKNNGHKEPSEVDAPFVWKNIRIKNQRRRLEENTAKSPLVMVTPPSWRNIIGMLFVCYFTLIISAIQ